MIRLINLIKEELVGEILRKEVYKNPKSIKRMVPDLRAVSYPNGDLFVVDDNKILVHHHIRKGLNKLGYKYPDRYDAYKDGYIPWIRNGNTNDFYLSGSIPYDYFTTDFMKKLSIFATKIKRKNPKCNFLIQSIDVVR